MDKETLIRLATPASIFLLALSIFSVPIISKADLGGLGTKRNPLYISCISFTGNYYRCGDSWLRKI